MEHLFANMKWTCCNCGKAAQPGPTCPCSVKCECGVTNVRGAPCLNQAWHIAKQFAEEAADLIVADMAESYKLFQREHMAARLKRAVVRQTQPIILATFEGVEAAKRVNSRRQHEQRDRLPDRA